MDLFERSILMFDELQNELNDSEFIDGGIRLELVYECCQIAIEHGIAVKTLLETNLITSALALFRVQFEAVVRAYWLLMAATNNEILKFEIKSLSDLLKNSKAPMVSEMIQHLKCIPDINHIAAHFEEFKFYHLKHLNSLVHTGQHSIVRSKLGLDDELYSNIMKQSNGLGMLAAQILLKHTYPDKQHYIGHLRTQYRDCFLFVEDISPEEKARFHAMYTKS